MENHSKNFQLIISLFDQALRSELKYSWLLIFVNIVLSIQMISRHRSCTVRARKFMSFSACRYQASKSAFSSSVQAPSLYFLKSNLSSSFSICKTAFVNFQHVDETAVNNKRYQKKIPHIFRVGGKGAIKLVVSHIRYQMLILCV